MKNRPDFAAVEAFAKVAETGSFRAAALALAAPASTVSVQVSRLEERLGTKLFERTTRRVSLTEEGRLYFEQVRTAIEAMVEADRSVAGRTGEARGRVRVAAPVELGQAVLGAVIGRYTREHPEVEVAVELTSARVDPLRDGFDVALQLDPPASSSLVARKVGAPMKYWLLASPRYLAERGAPAHPRELAKHACLVMGTRQASTTWSFTRGSSRQSIVHRSATANSWLLLRDLAVAGRGIARLPDYLGTPAIADGTLRPVLDGFCPTPEQMFAVYPRSRYLPLRTSAFVLALKRHLDVWPGCLAQNAGRRAEGRHTAST
ncbi:Transcriptional regulator, LysR family protein [Minicystis rosea]|nr:Transcriptional regulator, LysR family protein [Minicystis rosea]